NSSRIGIAVLRERRHLMTSDVKSSRSTNNAGQRKTPRRAPTPLPMPDQLRLGNVISAASAASLITRNVTTSRDAARNLLNDHVARELLKQTECGGFEVGELGRWLRVKWP